jgi:hypothetical protein
MNRFQLLVVVLLAAVLVLPARAQINLGLIGGINIADLSGKDPSTGEKLDFSSQTGLGVGGVLDIGFSQNVSLCFEPMYLQKGAKEKLEDPASLKVGTLEAPALLKLSFGTSDTQPYILAGPAIAFVLRSNLELGGQGISVKLDASDITKSTDFTINFGGGVNFQLQSLSIFIEGRYALGLSDVAKAGEITVLGVTEQFDDADIKTRGILIMGGVAFPMGRK